MKLYLTRRVVFFSGLLAALFAGVIFLVLSRPASKTERENEPRTARAEKRDIVDAIKFRGSVVAAHRIPIVSESSGQILKLYARQGERVEKGQLLVEIDPGQVRQRVEMQKLNVEKTAITYKNMQQEFERSEALFKENFIPESKLKGDEKARDLAKLDHELAEKELAMMTEQLGKVKILAPISGVVTAQNIEEGEVVASMLESSGGKVLMVITDTTDKFIEAFVSDVERAVLKPGHEVSFWLDTEPGRPFKGRVVKIDEAAATPERGAAADTAINRYRVEVQAPDAGKFMLGSSVTVEAVLREARGVLSVPTDAVFRDGSQKFAYVKKGGGYVKKPVSTGLSDTSSIQILSGLKEGETVFLDEPEIG